MYRSRLRVSHDSSKGSGRGRSRGMTRPLLRRRLLIARTRGPEAVTVLLGPGSGPGSSVPVSATAVPPHFEGVAVHPAGRRALDPLAGEVVDRAVARALEPPGALAERHPAAEVRALLRQGEQVAVRVDDVQATLGEVRGCALVEALTPAQADVPRPARRRERAAAPRTPCQPAAPTSSAPADLPPAEKELASTLRP